MTASANPKRRWHEQQVTEIRRPKITANDIVRAQLARQARRADFLARIRSNWPLAAAFAFMVAACVFAVLAMCGGIGR